MESVTEYERPVKMCKVEVEEKKVDAAKVDEALRFLNRTVMGTKRADREIVTRSVIHVMKTCGCTNAARRAFVNKLPWAVDCCKDVDDAVKLVGGSVCDPEGMIVMAADRAQAWLIRYDAKKLAKKHAEILAELHGEKQPAGEAAGEGAGAIEEAKSVKELVDMYSLAGTDRFKRLPRKPRSKGDDEKMDFFSNELGWPAHMRHFMGRVVEGLMHTSVSSSASARTKIAEKRARLYVFETLSSM